MRRSRVIYQPSSKPTARSILLHFIVFLALVSFRVTSLCIEEDCVDPKSITVFNPQSGECVSCFPCPPCIEGQIPSVPCGSTVPQGTDINCIPIQPDPVVSTTAVTLTPLVTSPSVNSGYSSLTKSKQISVYVPVTSHVHPMVVAVSSSKYYGGIGYSVVHSVIKEQEKPRKKRESPEEKHQKQVSNTFIYKFSAFSLIFIIVGIYYRYRKGKDKHAHLPLTAANGSPTREPFSTNCSEQESDICIINPERVTAVYSRSSHKDGQKPKKGNNNQCDVDSPEETLTTILSDVPFAEGDESNNEVHLQDSNLNEELLVDLSPGTSPINLPCPPDQSTTNVLQALGSCGPSIVTSNVNILVQASSYFQPPNQLDPQNLDIWNENAGQLEQGHCVNWPALSQSDRYKMKIVQVPFPLLNKICLSLDVKRNDGKDVRLLAHELGCMVPRDFELMEQAAIRKGASTTYVILKERFLTKNPSVTVGEFMEIMKSIGRNDITALIDE